MDVPEGVESIALPSTLETVGELAFFRCNNLESIHIPANILTIGRYVLRECDRLTSIDVSPDNGTYASADGILYDKVGTALLVTPNGKGGSVQIPDGVRAIEEYAFYKNWRIGSVEIPDTVLEIGYCSFAETVNLRTVNIPSNLERMDDYAFNVSGIESVTIPSTLEDPSKPSGWGDNTFQMCSHLTAVVIEEGITRIPDFAFYLCTSLKRATLPSTLEEFGTIVFTECASLEKISIPGPLKTVPEYTFDSCTALASVVIEEGLISIGNNAFSNCTSITSLTLPDSLTHIGDCAFEECRVLRTVHIGEGLVGIGTDAFYNCKDIMEFDVSNGNTTYDDIDGVLFSDDSLTPHTFPSGRAGEYKIPLGTEEMRNMAFLGCERLTAIHIPATLSILPEHPLYNCPSLERITVDENNPNYSSVDGALFNGDLSVLKLCPSGRTSITIPSETIMFDTFSLTECIQLERIIIQGGDRIVVEAGAFFDEIKDVRFESGRDGYELKVYMDCAHTIPFSVDYVNEGTATSIYFEWTEVQDTGGDIDIPLWTMIGVTLTLGAVAVLMLRRPQ